MAPHPDGRLPAPEWRGVLPILRPGVDPAAGAEVTVTVPGGRVWELVALRVALVTDATVATRRVVLAVDDGVTVCYQHEAGATQAASLTRTYTFASRLGYEQTAFPVDELVVGILPLTLPGGFRLRTISEALQPGDNYGAPVLYIVEHALGPRRRRERVEALAGADDEEEGF